MLAENKAVVEKIGEAYDERDYDQIRELLSPDFIGHVPLEPKVLEGPEAWIGFFQSVWHVVFPDVRITDYTLIAEGDLVVIHLREEGTFKNEFMGIPPNGKKVATWGANIWRIKDGKAVEWWVNMDMFGLLQQMGAIPPMG